ncbi:hypothetical protein ACT29H_12835 [Thermophagus sp. OGC60D27]|uniref:hypothetical protein n=1 Tax=Thermophagus sp. OGC60D27 TaxID=3458415 RepID=UPI00403795C9
MNDIKTHQKWIEIIQERKKWPRYTQWSNHEFEIISREIEQLTGVYISRNTIRNVIEKVKTNDPNYNPQTATKNAFANYVGYNNWEKLGSEHKRTFSVSKALLAGLMISAIMLIIVFFILNFDKEKPTKETNNRNFTFKVENPRGTAPHTVKCKYDFSGLNTDDIEIDYRHIGPNGNYLLRKIHDKKGIQTQCFHFPGIYRFNLFINNKEAYDTLIVVYSRDWFIHASEARIQQVIVPEYVHKRGFFSPRRVLFDNILKKNITRNGYLHIPKQEINKIEGLSTNYNISVQNIQDYGIPARNSSLKVRFKNEDIGKRVHCYEALIMLQGENGNIEIKIAEEGCSQYTFLRVGSKVYSGKKNDIRFLEIDFSDFREIGIRSNEKEVSFFTEEKLLYTMQSEQDLGRLIGISLIFKNSPHLDYVELYNEGGDIIYSDYFQN